MNTGKRLREVRKYLGFTQKILGEKLDMEWHKIRDLESTKLILTTEIALKIENFFSISGWWLLTGKGEMLLNEQKSENVNKNFSGNQIVTGGNNITNTINNGTDATVNAPKAVQKSADIEEMCAMMVQYAPREYVQQVRGKLEAFRELVEGD
jgi:DNA-binding XRE family transcriptional regulator